MGSGCTDRSASAGSLIPSDGSFSRDVIDLVRAREDLAGLGIHIAAETGHRIDNVMPDAPCAPRLDRAGC